MDQDTLSSHPHLDSNGHSNILSTIPKPIAAPDLQKDKDGHDIEDPSPSNCQNLISDVPTRNNEEDPSFISPHLECELAKAERSFAEHDLSSMEEDDKASHIQNHSNDHPHPMAKEDTNTNLQPELAINQNTEDVTNPIKGLSQSPSCNPLNQISPATTTTAVQNSSGLSMISSHTTSEIRRNININLQLNSAEINNLDNPNNSIEVSCSLPAHTAIKNSSLSRPAAAADSSSELSAISSQSISESKKHTNLDLRPDINVDTTHNLIEATSQLSSHSPSNELLLLESPDSSDKSANSTAMSFQSATHGGFDVNNLPTLDDHPENSSSSTVISFHSATHDESDANVIPTIEGDPQNLASSTVISFQSATHEGSNVEVLLTTECHPLFDPNKESHAKLRTQHNHKHTRLPGTSSPTRIVQSKLDTSKTLTQTDRPEEVSPDAKPLRASTALPVFCKLISALEEAISSNCLTDLIEEELNKVSFMCRQTGTAIIQKVPLPPQHKAWIIIDDEDEDLGAKYGFSLHESLHSKGSNSKSPKQSSMTLSTSDNVSQVQLGNEAIKDTDLIGTTNGLVDAPGFERFGDNQTDDLGGGGEHSPASKFSANLDREEEENPANPPASCQQTNKSPKSTSQSPESTAPDDRRRSRSQQMTDLASQVSNFEQADIRRDREASESLPDLNIGEKDPPAEASHSHQPTNQIQNNTTQSAELQTSYEPRRTRSQQQNPKSNTHVSHSANSQQSNHQSQPTVSRTKSPATATHQKDLRKRGAPAVELQGVVSAAKDSNKTLASPSTATQKTDEATTQKAGSKKRLGESEVTTQAVGTKKRKTVEGNDSAVVCSAKMEKDLTQLLSPYSGNQTSIKAKLAAWDALNSLLERRRVGEPLDQVFADSIDGGTNDVIIRTEFNAQNWFETINKYMPDLFNSHKGEPAYAAGFFNTLFVKTESLAEKVPPNVPLVWHQTWRSMRMSLRPSPTRVSVFLKVLLDSVLMTSKTFLKNPPRSESEKAMSGVQAVCQAIRWLNSQKTLKGSGSNSNNVRLLDSDNTDSLVDIGLIQQWQDVFIKVVDSYVVLHFEVNYILKEDASPEDKAIALKFKKDWKGESIKAPTLSYLVIFACCGIRGLICCSGDVNVAPAGQMLSFAVLSEWMCKARPDFKVTEPVFKRSNQTLMKLLDGLFDKDGCFVTPEITWYKLAKNLCFDYLSHWFSKGGSLSAGKGLVFPKSSAFSGKDQIIKFPGGS